MGEPGPRSCGIPCGATRIAVQLAQTLALTDTKRCYIFGKLDISHYCFWFLVFGFWFLVSLSILVQQSR
jgi:hypothetical protein